MGLIRQIITTDSHTLVSDNRTLNSKFGAEFKATINLLAFSHKIIQTHINLSLLLGSMYNIVK